MLCTTKTTLASDFYEKEKAWEKNNQWQASSRIENHGHLDGIPLSFPVVIDSIIFINNFIPDFNSTSYPDKVP